MSFSDTQSAKRYAAIAEVAAAQAKIYAQELEEAPNYAAEAAASAEAAATSSSSASQYAGNAAEAATSASSSASAAAASAASAAGAAQSAIGQTVRAPQGETLSPMPAASSRQNKYIATDSAGGITLVDRSTIPVLDSNGKLPVSTIPAIALTQPFVVSNQAAMLALDAQPGDIAKRTDLGYSFCLAASPASTLSNWIQLTDDVLAQLGLSSGAAQVGATSLTGASSTVQAELSKKPDSANLAASNGAASVGAQDDSGSATTVQGALNLKVSTANLGTAAAGKGDYLVQTKQSLTGAIARALHYKNADIVSVNDFGAIGDGALHPLSERFSTLTAAQMVYSFVTSLSDSIDWAALQAACFSGAGTVLIPSDTKLNITSTVNLSNRNFCIKGDGATSVITGSVNTMFLSNSNSFDPSGAAVYTLEFDGIKFISSLDNAVCINLTTTWTAGGKMPHIIRNCYFVFSGLSQTAILLSGVWSAKITGNSFINTIQNSKSVNGGFGVRTAFTNDMASSVMNVTISNNNFMGISYPLYIPPRVSQTGGRFEGGIFTGNNAIFGITGIYVEQGLALNISGNQISDFSASCIFISGCSGVSITGNCELTSDNVVISINNSDVGYSESITINSNNITCVKPGSKCIQIANAQPLTLNRHITIIGNILASIVGTTDTYGVFLTGAAPVTNSVVSGNVFSQIMYGVFFGGITTTGANSGFHIKGNTYTLNAGGSPVIFPERATPLSLYEYATSGSVAVTAGQTIIDIDVTAAAFMQKPIYADLQINSATNVRAVYDYSVSTTTSLRFNLVGTIAAGTQNYSLISKGVSVYGY